MLMITSMSTLPSPNPGATDKAIAVKLQEAVSRILLELGIRKLLLGQGLDEGGNSQEDFARIYVNEISKWAKVVRAVGLEPNQRNFTFVVTDGATTSAQQTK